MDRGQILIVNLSQSRTGEPASNLLGAFLVSSLHLSAMSRADTREPDRRDFMCYVDEFQNLATESFASILSQARKYRVSLTMTCHQYLDQIGRGDIKRRVRKRRLAGEFPGWPRRRRGARFAVRRSD